LPEGSAHEHSFGRVIPASITGAVGIRTVGDYSVENPYMKFYSYQSTGVNYSAGMDVALDDRWDVGFRIPLGSPLRLHLKYQLFGKPESLAEKGQFSGAIDLGAGFFRGQETQAGKGGIKSATLLITDVYFDLALLGGWRASDNILLYGGPSYAFHNVSAEVE